HVEAGLGIQPGAADAAPEEPPPEIPPRESLLRNQVLHHHVREIEAFQAGRAGAQTPFADFLTEQCAGLAADARIESAGSFDGLAAHRHVDTEGNARAELDRTVAIVE